MTPSNGEPFLLQIGFIAIALVMIYASYRLSRSFVAFDADEYTARTDLSATYIEPGLNVDNLPTVTVNFGDYRPSQNTGDVDDNDEDERDEHDEIRRATCLQRGVYLGAENKYVNCADYCLSLIHI